MEDFHPTETAGSGKPERDTKLRALAEDTESFKWECPHCGFINDIRTDNPKNAQGEGTAFVTTIQTGGSTLVEPVRVAGCLLCRHNYTIHTYNQRFWSTVNLQGR